MYCMGTIGKTEKKRKKIIAYLLSLLLLKKFFCSSSFCSFNPIFCSFFREGWLSNGGDPHLCKLFEFKIGEENEEQGSPAVEYFLAKI